MINLVRSETPTPLNCKDVTTGKGFSLLVGSHIDLLVNAGGGGGGVRQRGRDREEHQREGGNGQTSRVGVQKMSASSSTLVYKKNKILS